MAGFIDSFKMGYAGEDDSEHFVVAGVRVRCSHCGGERFEHADALLNTPGLTMLGLDWANRSANLFVCASCGHLEWFLVDPERG